MEYTGGCYCGSIILEMELPNSSTAYQPRTCDCDFCTKHGASYLSDPGGRLAIKVKNTEHYGEYRQGSNTSDFLICRNCGVLIGAIYEENGEIRASVNSKAFGSDIEFDDPVTASPKKLEKGEKVQRWKELWFRRVQIIMPSVDLSNP
mgnify:CR=1 FL=1